MSHGKVVWGIRHVSIRVIDWESIKSTIPQTFNTAASTTIPQDQLKNWSVQIKQQDLYIQISREAYQHAHPVTSLKFQIWNIRKFSLECKNDVVRYYLSSYDIEGTLKTKQTSSVWILLRFRITP